MDCSTSSNDLYELGRRYYDEQNYAEAIKYFELGLSERNDSSMVALGVMYGNGIYVVKDHVKAEKFLMEAVEYDNIHAANNLLIMAINYQTTKNYDKAEEILIYLFNKNYKFVEDHLFNLTGEYVKENEMDKTKKILEQIISKCDHASSFIVLGILYYDPANRNIEKSIKFFEKGIMLLENEDTYKKIINIVTIFLKQIKKICYENGKSQFKDHNYDIAKRYLNMCQDMGKAKYILGKMHCAVGEYDIAKKLFVEAASQNHIGSMNMLGYMHITGKGCDINYSEAEKYFKSVLQANKSQHMQYAIDQLYWMYFKNNVNHKKEDVINHFISIGKPEMLKWIYNYDNITINSIILNMKLAKENEKLKKENSEFKNQDDQECYEAITLE